MSELRLRPEFAIGSEHDITGAQYTSSDLTALQQPAANDAVRALGQLRGSRRRFGALRLRMPSDDGFHPFRIY
jgi:hypothetical protein